MPYKQPESSRCSMRQRKTFLYATNWLFGGLYFGVLFCSTKRLSSSEKTFWSRTLSWETQTFLDKTWKKSPETLVFSEATTKAHRGVSEEQSFLWWIRSLFSTCTNTTNLERNDWIERNFESSGWGNEIVSSPVVKAFTAHRQTN